MTASGDKWPVWKLAVLFYPFVVLTVAVNLFFAGLIAQSAGWTGLTMAPLTALMLSVPLGLPVTWAAGRWIRHLMEQADE